MAIRGAMPCASSSALTAGRSCVLTETKTKSRGAIAHRLVRARDQTRTRRTWRPRTAASSSRRGREAPRFGTTSPLARVRENLHAPVRPDATRADDEHGRSGRRVARRHGAARRGEDAGEARSRGRGRGRARRASERPRGKSRATRRACARAGRAQPRRESRRPDKASTPLSKVRERCDRARARRRGGDDWTMASCTWRNFRGSINDVCGGAAFRLGDPPLRSPRPPPPRDPPLGLPLRLLLRNPAPSMATGATPHSRRRRARRPPPPSGGWRETARRARVAIAARPGCRLPRRRVHGTHRGPRPPTKQPQEGSRRPSPRPPPTNPRRSARPPRRTRCRAAAPRGWFPRRDVGGALGAS